MGNEINNQKQSQKSVAYGNYNIKSINGISFVEKSYTLHSEEEKQSFKDLTKIIKQLDIPTIIQIYDLIQDNLNVVVGYQYCQQTLQEEIEIKNKTYFKYTERQIYNFIDCVLSGLMAFSFKGLHHKDLRPSNILVGYHKQEKHNKLYKIGYPLLMNPETMEKQYTKSRISNIYFGPQLYQTVAKLSPKSYSLQKNDVFSLGLITLKLVTLRNIESVYNHSSGQINMLELSKYLKICEQNYRKQLVLLLREMLQIDENARPNFAEVFQILEPLLNQETFQVASQKSLKSVNKKISRTSSKVSDNKSIQRLEPSSNRSKYIPTFCHVNNQFFLKQIHRIIPVPDKVDQLLNKSKI